jgi:mRNA interferase MazF
MIRPVLITQTEALLAAGHPSTYAIPLSTRLVQEAEPLRIRVPASGRLPKDSDLLMDQMRAIDNQRFVRGPLTRLSGRELERVLRALNELLEP